MLISFIFAFIISGDQEGILTRLRLLTTMEAISSSKVLTTEECISRCWIILFLSVHREGRQISNHTLLTLVFSVSPYGPGALPILPDLQVPRHNLPEQN